MRPEAAEWRRERLAQAAIAWDLTPRQTEIVDELLLGHANKEIARRLKCTEATVERHITEVLRKTGTDSRLALVAKFWTESPPWTARQRSGGY